MKTKELGWGFGLLVFEVAFFAVADGEREAQSHEADGWEEQDEDAAADGTLAGGGGGFGGAVAHGAALAEARGGRRYECRHEDDGEAAGELG
ncbi:MAG TPA: hypothetical protein VI386_26940 [Candidatus Sulfotelmatobacter sp.]